MKKLQLKYNFLHIFYWIATGALCAYVAVFLQYKGMNNTEIGIVTGGQALLTVFLSPFLSKLIARIPSLTIKKLLTAIYIGLTITFLAVTFLDLPAFAIIFLYMFMMAFDIAVVPFLSMIASNYIQEGKDINFGLGRGAGSVAYAGSALVLGTFVELFSPDILVIIFGIFSVFDLLVLYSMPDSKISQSEKAKETSNHSFFSDYQMFFFLLICFSCLFSATSALSTYLINIVKNLGGSTSTYGIAIFFMAVSEMPAMAITPYLLRKYDSISLIAFAAFVYILRNFTITFAPNLYVLILAMLLQSFSYGLFNAVISYYVTNHLKIEDQMMGHTMIAIMTTGIGATLGNLGGGMLQDALGIIGLKIFTCTMTLLGAFIIWFIKLKTKIAKKIK